jgi:RecB family endonuclease NucS
VYDEFLLKIEAASAIAVERVRLADLGMRERDHLQEWILAHPAVLGVGVEIVTTEYDRWQTAGGDPILDRLDLLGVGSDGHCPKDVVG